MLCKALEKLYRDTVVYLSKPSGIWQHQRHYGCLQYENRLCIELKRPYFPIKLDGLVKSQKPLSLDARLPLRGTSGQGRGLG